MNSTEIIGSSIKNGSTGRQPRIAAVIWQGTAEVIGVEACHRRPAAIVDCASGERHAVVQLSGQEEGESNRWWHAVLLMTREWESEEGELVSGDIARTIDALLSSPLSIKQESAKRELHERLLADKYAV